MLQPVTRSLKASPAQKKCQAVPGDCSQSGVLGPLETATSGTNPKQSHSVRGKWNRDYDLRVDFSISDRQTETLVILLLSLAGSLCCLTVSLVPTSLPSRQI